MDSGVFRDLFPISRQYAPSMTVLATLLQLSLISIAFFGFHSRLQSSKFSLRKKPRCSHVGFSAQSLICHELNEWLSNLRLPCESPTVNNTAISLLPGSDSLRPAVFGEILPSVG